MDGIRLLLLFLNVIFASCASTGVSSDYENSPQVNNLRNYLRIRAMHPNVNYDESIDYLKRQADSLGLPYQVVEVLPGKPVLVMSWQGTEPALSSVLLNSHMDVVPVFEKSWNHPPFEAFMDDNGTIYGRGIQDMKSVAIQYIEAVRKLIESGVRLKRTVHLSFVPDEEIGGHLGMEKFVTTNQYKDLNVGFSLDEGMASETDDYIVFYAERSIWHMTVHCPGKSGHGSLLHNNTAGEKIRYVIDKLLDLREENKRRLESDPDLTVGDVTTINLTKLGGGIQANVVPEVLSATFDIRLALSVNHTEFEDKLNTWFTEAGEGITYEFVQKEPYVPPTSLGDDNPYWVAFKNIAQQLNLSLKKRVFPGGTDSRYIRALGVPCLGFSPMTNTRLQLHEHNESLKASTFLQGISLYEKIIPALANV